MRDSKTAMNDTHNYQIVIAWFSKQRAYVAGTVSNTTVKHDDWCAIYNGGYCNCKPEIWINGARKSYPASLLKGRVQR